jgi:hypothetical protein
MFHLRLLCGCRAKPTGWRPSPHRHPPLLMISSDMSEKAAHTDLAKSAMDFPVRAWSMRGGCDRFPVQHIPRRGRRRRACSRHLWSVVKLQEHSWSLFLRHKRVGTLAQALTREGAVERTFTLNVIGEIPSTARVNTSFVRVVESRRMNPCQSLQRSTKRECLRAGFSVRFPAEATKIGDSP